MASAAIFLTIISIIFASTSGFKIEIPQPINTETFSVTSRQASPKPVSLSTVTLQLVPDYRNQPIAGYPKVPPPNAHEAGGNEEDLFPPLEDSVSVYDHLKRSIEDVKVDPKTGYPLVAEPSWKYSGGSEDNLELPLEDSEKTKEEQTAVDPKTGYPLVAEPSWKYSGGNEDNLELPLEDSEKTEEEPTAVDPKTGYPLIAQPHWKDAGGNGEIISLPFEDTQDNFGQKAKAVDPKTGYPLEADPSWKEAGGNEEILELPFEDSVERSDKEAVDPKTGYPLIAQENWKDAGGDEKILELPLEEPDKEATDPKTGYPLIAQPFWKDAGGDGDILKLPLENTYKNSDTAAVHLRERYSQTSQFSLNNAERDKDIHQLPLEAAEVSNQAAIDPKTGYPLTAQPSWKDAGGNGDILQPPRQPSDKMSIEEPVDPKTGYPLVAHIEWKDAGGNGDILELPFEQTNDNSPSQEQSPFGGEYDVYEIFKLTELQPPPLEKNFPTVFSNSFSTPSPLASKQIFSNTPSGNQNQKRNSIASQTQYNLNNGIRPVERFYANTGPENVIVTVTRF